MQDRFWTFVGGNTGQWRIVDVRPVVGEGLACAPRLEILNDDDAVIRPEESWRLRGVTGNTRYTNRSEQNQLAAVQEGLGRPAATLAALIPIRKNAAWWALTQDERRAIFEEQSRHVAVGLKYLPAIARRLHHCRDLGDAKPFDFLTLFDYANSDEPAFDEMLGIMRGSEEWKYVDREVDIRMIRVD